MATTFKALRAVRFGSKDYCAGDTIPGGLSWPSENGPSSTWASSPSWMRSLLIRRKLRPKAQKMRRPRQMRQNPQPRSKVRQHERDSIYL